MNSLSLPWRDPWMRGRTNLNRMESDAWSEASKWRKRDFTGVALMWSTGHFSHARTGTTHLKRPRLATSSGGMMSSGPALQCCHHPGLLRALCHWPSRDSPVTSPTAKDISACPTNVSLLGPYLTSHYFPDI